MRSLAPRFRMGRLPSPWFDDFDQLFENAFAVEGEKFIPAVDVSESEEYILISFDLPGMEEKDVKVELENNQLTVSGERVREFKEEKSMTRFSRRQFGQFTRSFQLPDTINSEKVEADYSNGVLKVLLPKKEVTKPKKVEIKAKKGGLLHLLKGDE